MDFQSIIIDFAKFILSIIIEYWGYHSGLHNNMKVLKDKDLGDLNCSKSSIQKSLDEQHFEGETEVRDDVKSWLQSAEEINRDIEILEEEAKNVKYVARCLLGKQVSEKIKEVKELQRKGTTFPARLVTSCSRRGHILPAPTRIMSGIKSGFQRTLQEIWAHLDEFTAIGVTGMGGIGKTTALTCINNHIMEEKDKFDNVIFVTVSKGVDIRALQDKISNELNLDINNADDERTKATKIRTRLEARKRFVLILDDLWEDYALEVIGIPELTMENGRKVMVTTRSRDVCRLMRLHEIQMEMLTKEEAMDLFLREASPNISSDPGLRETLEQIVEECKGLPLAVVTVAKSLVGTNDHDEWTDILEDFKELKKVLEPTKKVMEILRFSYDRLKDQNLQKCLLYCALYPEDYEIRRDVLIEQLIAEGISATHERRHREIGKGQVMVNQLVKANLLNDVISSDGARCVKMHDLIRDMTLQIASESHGYLVKMKSLPEEDDWKDLKKVSLINIHDIPSGYQPLECPELSTLFVTQSSDLGIIPNDFFCHMKVLNVLDLSFSGVRGLPESVSDLVTLTALFLRYTGNLRYVPSLAKLKKLTKLDFYHSGIESIPEGLEMLINLKYLNFDNCPLTHMPSGILNNLTNLQYLALPHSNAGPKVIGEDLELVSKLENFEGVLYDVNSFNAYVSSSQRKALTSYILQLGFCNTYVYHALVEGRNKMVYLTEDWQSSRTSTDANTCSLLLPKDANVLAIRHCHNDNLISSLFDLPSASDASQLRFCHVEDCGGIEHLFYFSSRNAFPLLPKLEILDLDGVWDLRGLIIREGSPRVTSPPISSQSFSSLKELRMCNCNNVKTLFPLEAASLPNLEQLTLSRCEQLEAIVPTDALTLPKLRRLVLSKLPKLQRLPVIADSLQEVHIDKCPELRKTDSLLDREQCPASLMHVYIDHDTWELLEWDCLDAKDFVWSRMTLTHDSGEEEEEAAAALYWRNIQEEEEEKPALFERPLQEEEATSYWRYPSDEDDDDEDDGEDDDGVDDDSGSVVVDEDGTEEEDDGGGSDSDGDGDEIEEEMTSSWRSSEGEGEEEAALYLRYSEEIRRGRRRRIA